MNAHFRIIILSNPESVPNEEEKIHTVLNLDPNIVFHFRRKTFCKQDESMLHHLSQLYAHRIVIHQEYSCAKKYMLKGIHLTQIEYTQYPQWNKEYPIISTSFHNLEQIQNNPYAFEYAFLSPIFPSISKKNYVPTLSHTMIKSFLHDYNQIPILALGGCEPEHIPYVQDLGFKGIAFLGSVWKESIFTFIEKLQKYL